MLKKFFILIMASVTMLFTSFCVAEMKLPSPPSLNSVEQAQVLPPEDAKRLALVMAYIQQYYVKSVSRDSILNNAISGMLSHLDPHSDYLDESDFKSLKSMTSGKFGGIGVEIIPDQGVIRVVSPLDDTPAAAAGIKSGDLIVQVDNKLVKDMSVKNAVDMMRGPRGSKVKLTIVRKNQLKPINLTLTRQIIKVQSIKMHFLEPNYAYVRIASFQDPTEKDLAMAIQKIKKISKGDLKGLILDLRNNPGGILDAAICISDDFLDSNELKDNKLIVYTKGQFEGAHTVANATPGELLPHVPLVVLINEGSASAAEIVAGALQDHKRAVIVGTRSFGKGSVQTLLPLDAKSAIKLTTAFYYTPNGRSIQAKGIVPDVIVNEMHLSKNHDDSKGLIRVNEAKLMDHFAHADADNTDMERDIDNSNNEAEQSEKQNALARKDYQLYEALNILKGVNANK